MLCLRLAFDHQPRRDDVVKVRRTNTSGLSYPHFISYLPYTFHWLSSKSRSVGIGWYRLHITTGCTRVLMLTLANWSMIEPTRKVEITTTDTSLKPFERSRYHSHQHQHHPHALETVCDSLVRPITRALDGSCLQRLLMSFAVEN